jgi:phage terminase small subunit
MPPLENHREELVAQGLAVGKSKTKACKDAGYNDDRGHASRKSAQVNIRQRATEIQQQNLNKFILSRDWVTAMLVENVNRAMQVTQPKDAEGNPTGNYQYQGNVANRALELLAKTLGMLVEKSEVTRKRDYADLSNLELLQLLAKEARELELLEKGKVINAEALDQSLDSSSTHRQERN